MRFEEAYRLLVKPGDGPISRHLNRRISIRISLFLVRHGSPISPTQMSAISFATALLGSLAFLLGCPLAGGLLAQLSSILDGCDGELARLTGQISKRGGLVDSLLDRLADVALLLGLAHLAYRSPWPAQLWPTWLPRPGDWHLLALFLTALALAGSLLVSYCSAIFRALAGHQPRRHLGTRDVRLFLVMWAGITGQLWPWSAAAWLALLVLLAWAEVLSCLGQAMHVRG